jgi:hypothetical protein
MGCRCGAVHDMFELHAGMPDVFLLDDRGYDESVRRTDGSVAPVELVLHAGFHKGCGGKFQNLGKIAIPAVAYT